MLTQETHRHGEKRDSEQNFNNKVPHENRGIERAGRSAANSLFMVLNVDCGYN